jgi:prepilin-type N-terminal cleavage/methylation domain-containing protein
MSIQRKGFTLIELMVTIAIFSLIASISYYALSASFQNKSVQNKHSSELFQLQKTLNFLERDITQTSNQKITLDSSGLTLSTLQNDQLLTIQYSVSSNQLFRKDITNFSKPIILGLLDQINTAKIRILDHQNQWQIKWNFNENKSAKAIEIKFKHPFWGDLIKLVMINE